MCWELVRRWDRIVLFECDGKELVNMKCFYHSSDLDGHCSGAIVGSEFPECELIGISYGDRFPWECIEANETIVMVDYALQPFEDMLKLRGMCDLIWIDHHVTAIDESRRNNFCPKGWWKVGDAACELTWKYFVSDDLPLAVYLIGRHDVWDHSDDRTLPFNYGIKRCNTRPTERDFWKNLFTLDSTAKNIGSIIQEGQIILDYIKRDSAEYVEACSFEVTLDGLKCIAANRMLCGSQLFDSVWDSQKYDAMLAFGYRKGRWSVSLYTDKEGIDVSRIAKNRGGGGHKRAAGFQTDTLPFVKIEGPKEI